MSKNYREAFAQELQKLNTAQREAVQQLDGPVLVVAGPGTGKTQILSARIAHILSSADTQASPHNILCLTYTDAGRVSMRKRLLSMIGPEAHKIPIHTFHSFCNQVIQENMDLFGGSRELQTLSELEEIDLYQTLIDRFEPENPLRKLTGDVYSMLRRLKSLFQLLKSEHISVNTLHEAIDAYLLSLPDREEFQYKKNLASRGIKAGDPKTAEIQKETEVMHKLKAASAEFHNYQKLMAERKRYDYQDMINWVLQAFEENETLLARYQEQFQYLLVDEYQDTNGLQNSILSQLVSYWEDPNLFVVGDDDQSIYSFQGAQLRRIEEFIEKHEKNLTVVVLKENYRSSQLILDASRAVIGYNHQRLIHNLTLQHLFAKHQKSFDKNLQAAHPEYKTLKDSVVLREYYNQAHEEADIVNQIEVLQAAGVPLNEVAIIYRQHTHVVNIVKALAQRHIPFNSKRKVDVLQEPLIKQILYILRYIQEMTEKPDSWHSDSMLFEILHYHYFGIPTRDIHLLSLQANKLRVSWRELLSRREKLLQMGIIEIGAMARVEELLSYWEKDRYNETLQVLIDKIVNQSGMMHFMLQSSEKLWYLEMLNVFYEFIKAESAKKPDLSLSELLDMLEKMQRYSIRLPLDRVAYAENGVHLLTAHSSKGLEFKYVFLINAIQENWEKRTVRSQDFRFPDTFTQQTIQEEEMRLEEERRLFYVAMTRAREKLYISYPAMKLSDAGLKEATVVRSQFIDELVNEVELQPEFIRLEEPAIARYLLESAQFRQEIEPQLAETEHLKEALKDYKMSVTHLNKYLNCRVAFYYENLLRVPSARSANMGFGNAIHYALEHFFRAMTESETQQFPPEKELLEFFYKGMNHYASHFTDKEFALRLEFGQKILPDLLKEYLSKWNKVVVLEYPIPNAVSEGVPISGKLDKLEFNGKQVNVVDYKTGNPDDSKTSRRLKGPNEKDPLGGDYWRQIVFYKILLDSDKRKNWEMISGEIDFVQPTKKGTFEKYRYTVTPEDLVAVKAQIKEAYSNILAQQFSPGCGKEDCRWCNFVKNNFRKDFGVAEEEE